MKKLLVYIYQMDGGGAEKVVSEICNYAADNNFNVVLVTRISETQGHYVLDSRIKNISLDAGFVGIPVIGGFFSTASTIISLRRIILQEEADTCLAFITESNVQLILACIGLPVKKIVSERNYPPKDDNPMKWRLLRKLFYKKADMVVSQTEKTRDWLRMSCSVTNSIVIPNAAIWPLRQSKKGPFPEGIVTPNECLMLAVGSLKYKKGFDRLINAYAAVASEYPNWRLVILGEGGLRNELIRQIQKLGLERVVCLPGRAMAVSSWFDRADLFVLSSRREGFPNVLVEAMSSGVACLALNCETGPAELIENGWNGVLVEENNAQGLSIKLKELMDSEETRQMLGKNAKAIRETLAEKKIYDKWVSIL